MLQSIEYYQISETVKEEGTWDRELTPLENIREHYPKYILTGDITPETYYNGIRKINVIDWLLEK